MKQPVDAIKHVLVLYKLAPVGLRDAPLHASDEAGLIVEHPGNRVFDQLPGPLAVGSGYLLESYFDIGREMYFHALKIREKRIRGNTGNGRAGKAAERIVGCWTRSIE
jgi:hypothetical protein